MSLSDYPKFKLKIMCQLLPLHYNLSPNVYKFQLFNFIILN